MEAIVIDSFDMKGRVAIAYGATGVVICITGETDGDQPQSGKNILLVRTDGWMVRTRMGEVKTGGTKPVHSIFIANLTSEDVPVGTRVRWGADFWPSASEEQTAPSPLVRA